MINLEKSILATIAYYNVLGFPLTNFEIYKYRIKINDKCQMTNAKLSFFNILETLENSKVLKGKRIEEKNGLYFLKGKSKLVKQRVERQKIAERKWKKIRSSGSWFWALPYLRGILVSGSLAQNNPKEESDLDLLVIAKAGRIWTLRALITFLVEIMGKRRRPYSTRTKDKICLNHYITDNSLEIPFKSLYNAQTYAHLVLLLQRTGDTYKKFQKANGWIGDYLEFWPNYSSNGNQKRLKPNKFLLFGGKIGEIVLNNKFGDLLEAKLKEIQMNHIQKDPLRYKKGGRITANDNQLEFHPDSPEKEILDRYNKNMLELKMPELAKEKDSGLQ